MPPDHPLPSKSMSRLLWVLFSLFVIYGTTFPFRFNLDPADLTAHAARISWHPFRLRDGDISLPDIVQNILLFIPFGFLGFVSVIDKSSHLRLKMLILVGMGASLSAFVEFLQIFSFTRFTSVSDVIFNALGTAVGVGMGHVLKGWVVGIKTLPGSRRILDAPSAFPALIFAGLAVAGTWAPFDFALDVTAFAYKARLLAAHPFDFTWPNDELAALIRFLLATLFTCRLGAEAGMRRPVLVLVPLLAVASMGLEATQVIISSRVPSFQDAFTGVLGVIGGGIAYGFPGFREHPWKWGAIGTLAVATSAAMMALHPYTFVPTWTGFNWLPFAAEYERTDINTLGNFLDNGVAFFPIGFLLGYFFPGSRLSAMVSLVVAILFSFGVETAQGFVPGRFPDVTDVIGAALGCLAGSLVLRRGWRAYRIYVSARPPKNQTNGQ